MDKLDKDIEKIKLARMKPEEKYLHNIFSNLTKIEMDELAFKYYDKNYNGIFIYHIKTKDLVVDKEIFFYLNSVYKISLTDMKILMRKYAKNYLNIDIKKIY